MKIFNKILIIILVIFHLIGVIGMLVGNQAEFAQLSWLNLLISTVIALVSYKRKLYLYLTPFLIVVLFSFFIEVIGVKTSLLFGSYYYGSALGIKALEVPVLIGFLWLTLSIGAKSIVLRIKGLPKVFVFLFSSALLFFIDYLMEPIAVKLNFWTWTNGQIPVYNYICWFIFAFINQLFLKNVTTRNIVVEVLFLINVLFFMILNLLL